MRPSTEPIKDILARRLRQRGLRRPVEAAYICEAVTKLGNGRFWATRFAHGTLTLTVASSAQAHELKILLPDIKLEIAEKLGTLLPAELRLRITVQPDLTNFEDIQHQPGTG